MLQRGDTLLMPILPGYTPHLWIVVTDPDPATQQCVIVNITTLRRGQDRTVPLMPGDHPFVQHASVIRFSDAQFANGQTLHDDLEGGTAKRREPCSDRLMTLVKAGLLASPQTPNKIDAYCRNLWGKPPRRSR